MPSDTLMTSPVWLARLEHVDVRGGRLELFADALGDGLGLAVALEGVALHILRETVERMGKRAVIDGVAHAHAHAADEVLVDLVAAGDEGLAENLRELLHLLVGERLRAGDGNIQFL